MRSDIGSLIALSGAYGLEGSVLLCCCVAVEKIALSGAHDLDCSVLLC